MNANTDRTIARLAGAIGVVSRQNRRRTPTEIRYLNPRGPGHPTWTK